MLFAAFAIHFQYCCLAAPLWYFITLTIFCLRLRHQPFRHYAHWCRRRYNIATIDICRHYATATLIRHFHADYAAIIYITPLPLRAITPPRHVTTPMPLPPMPPLVYYRHHCRAIIDATPLRHVYAIVATGYYCLLKLTPLPPNVIDVSIFIAAPPRRRNTGRFFVSLPYFSATLPLVADLLPKASHQLASRAVITKPLYHIRRHVGRHTVTPLFRYLVITAIRPSTPFHAMSATLLHYWILLRHIFF